MYRFIPIPLAVAGLASFLVGLPISSAWFLLGFCNFLFWALMSFCGKALVAGMHDKLLGGIEKKIDLLQVTLEGHIKEHETANVS